MEIVLSVMSEIQNYIIIGLILIILILIVLIVVIFNSLTGLEKRYRKFMRGVNNKNLEEVVLSYMDKVDSATKMSTDIKELYTTMDYRVKDCIQKTSIIRYRAFEDVGSDLSFSVAFLDQNNNGILLTGIYGRNDSTTYAKPIDQGISRYELSEEEKQVLISAMNKDEMKQRNK